jgi:hypothetical protein
MESRTLQRRNFYFNGRIVVLFVNTMNDEGRSRVRLGRSESVACNPSNHEPASLHAAQKYRMNNTHEENGTNGCTSLSQQEYLLERNSTKENIQPPSLCIAVLASNSY